MADDNEPDPDPDDPVPKLPRGGAFSFFGKLSMPQLLRIGITASILVLVVMMRQPCSDSVSKFVTDVGSGSTTHMPTPTNVDKGMGGDYELLSPDMTPQQVKEAIDRARGSGGSGSGSGSSSGSSGSGGGGGGGGGGSGTIP